MLSRPTDHTPISLAKWFGALSFALATPSPPLFSSPLRLSIMPHLLLPCNWWLTSSRILSGQLTGDPWIGETTSTEQLLRGRNKTDCWERKEENWHDCNCREWVLGAFTFIVMSPSRWFHMVGVSSSIFTDVKTKCEGNNPKSLCEPHAALTLQRENYRLQHWCSGPNTARITAPPTLDPGYTCAILTAWVLWNSTFLVQSMDTHLLVWIYRSCEGAWGSDFLFPPYEE